MIIARILVPDVMLGISRDAEFDGWLAAWTVDGCFSGRRADAEK